MTFTYVKEVPEIGLKAKLLCTYSGSSTVGCYSAMISGIALQPIPHYLSQGSGKGRYRWLESLDESKPLVYGKCTDKYSEYYNYDLNPPADSQSKFYDFVSAAKDAGEFLGEDFFQKLAEHITSNNGAAIYIMGDVINSYAPARNSGVDARDKAKGGFSLKVRDFARYLIDHKIGYTLESPIVQNPNHKVYGAYSLNQVWLWIPDSQLTRSINMASQHGEDKFPSKEKWLETVSEDFKVIKSVYSPKRKPGVSTEQDVFPEGKFPEGRRFSQVEA